MGHSSATTVSILLLLVVSAQAWPYYQNFQQFDPFRQSRDVHDNTVDTTDSIIGHLAHLAGQLYGEPNNETGLKVAEWHEGMNVNPEELGEYVEGDILFPTAIVGRNGVKAETARWPDGVIPYIMSPFFNQKQRRVIFEAMDDYHKYTCIRFKEYKGEESDYIRITAGNTGCWSAVGRVGGRQDVNLQVPGCVTKKGTIIHELMHAVGFLHEQSRYERDNYVSIQWHNIQRGRETNFEKSQRSTTDALGVGYDYGSVMHYSANAFSRNGQPTIVPREPRNILDFIAEIFQGNRNARIGQRDGLSTKDIQKIRRMYKCAKRRRSSSFFF
ncbi:zinc metalloproteinase nas-13-like [Phymastichus coffea]|uniref:zinc metalloproteinase nas-13-like n=1 Tax=Phymastichus coffea TaxID=108790 RepID=UPI00273A9F9F|nr:zinc metalloproteinase nas-13-like [Phymastichus coffea]